MNQITCPRCQGEKQVYINCFPTALAGWQKCDVCDGIGTITEIKQAMIEIGKDVREKRIKLRILTRDIAAKYNFTFAEWSNIEQGRNTLENAYRARAIVESLLPRIKPLFEVWEIGAFNHRRKVDTLECRALAESLVIDCRCQARAKGVMMVYEIKERIEEIIL